MFNVVMILFFLAAAYFTMVKLNRADTMPKAITFGILNLASFYELSYMLLMFTEPEILHPSIWQRAAMFSVFWMIIPWMFVMGPTLDRISKR